MLTIKVLCVGKLKEKFYQDAAGEYCKRLSGFCKLELLELPECKIKDSPSPAEVEAALKTEADAVESKLPKGAFVVAMAIEGKALSSEELSEIIQQNAISGVSRICFLLGSSLGLHERLKKRADLMLSMSRMTFPHHLARVMLLEQLYRSFQLLEGGKYHK